MSLWLGIRALSGMSYKTLYFMASVSDSFYQTTQREKDPFFNVKLNTNTLPRECVSRGSQLFHITHRQVIGHMGYIKTFVIAMLHKKQALSNSFHTVYIGDIRNVSVWSAWTKQRHNQHCFVFFWSQPALARSEIKSYWFFFLPKSLALFVVELSLTKITLC